MLTGIITGLLSEGEVLVADFVLIIEGFSWGSPAQQGRRIGVSSRRVFEVGEWLNHLFTRWYKRDG